MLTSLFVRHFAVIEEAEVELPAGMVVVTGETGAGKSLLVDALMLLSGARADNGMIRSGCERAELHASFALDSLPLASAWLVAQDMDDAGACQLRRVLKSNGSSRAWINGHPATLVQQAELAGLLLEIHGQHEHQALLSRPHQLSLLDAFGACAPCRQLVHDLARRWQDLEARAKTLSGGVDQADRIDLLRHELDELQRWALAPEALAELEIEHNRLANAERLLAGANRLAERLDGDNELAVRRALTRASSELTPLAETDAGLQPVLDLLTSASIQLDEAVDAITHYADRIDLDPTRYETADEHLAHLHELSRRHRVPAPELPNKTRQLQAELDEREGAGAALQRIAAERKALAADYAKAAKALGSARRDAASRLGEEVTRLMQELGMAGGVFAVSLQANTHTTPDPQGLERCEFLVSANPGQPPRPLRKVASGGELARIGLAIEVAALGLDEVGTMVFDEVDAGIGGAVAEVVGQKLRALGEHRQVLCVTHLPQVAAQGHHHLRVHKHQDASATDTGIDLLDQSARRDELARMLGGIQITAETLAHAGKMLQQAQTAPRSGASRGRKKG